MIHVEGLEMQFMAKREKIIQDESKSPTGYPAR